MSPERIWKFRIQDILESVRSIMEYVQGMDYDTFQNDPKTFDAVVRRLMIIGEAATHIPDDVSEKYPNIEWRQMAGMRNILVHEYFGVSEKIVWDTIQVDLPSIISPLEKLLESP